MSRKRLLTKSFLIISLALLFTAEPVIVSEVRQSQDQQDEVIKSPSSVSPAVMNNSRLRNYFFREYMERHRYNKARPPIPRGFIENWIDRQIIYNSGIIAEKLSSLQEDHEFCILLLKRLEDSPERTDIKLHTRRFFEKFRKDTKKLRSKIDFIVSGLDSEPGDDRINYSIEKDSVQQRMRAAKDELNEAGRLIRNYFLEPTHTVKVEDLAENNMLIRLYRIERIMESLEKTEL